jgi:uncharacterized membrane protein YeaQ/YmgE (transglycosylase-associated protein family)
MDFIVYLIILCLIGLVVGGLARLALPGRDPMSIPMTIAIGLAGSFMAGLIMWLVFGREYYGFLAAQVCAIFLVYLVRKSRGGGLLDPGDRSR